MNKYQIKLKCWEHARATRIEALTQPNVGSSQQTKPICSVSGKDTNKQRSD